MVGLNGRQSAAPQGGSPREQGPAIVGLGTPAVSDTQLDRIVQLQSKIRETEERFISDMTLRQLNVIRQANHVRAERARWNDLLKAVESNSGGRKPLTPEIRKELAQGLANAVDQMNGVWQILMRVENEFAANRVVHAGKLYNTFATPNDIVRTSPYLNSTTAMIVALVALMLFFGLWILRILARLVF
jgi:hypothetical protein